MKLSVIAASHEWVAPHLAELDATRFHSLFIADHPSFPVTDSWTWLAYAAAKTSRIRLGTHVTGAPFHHPTRLAKQVATVDVLSGGRAVLGIGTAYEIQDFRPYGFEMTDFAGRITYLEETILILRQLFTGRIDGFRGRFQQYEGAAEFLPKPVQDQVPIWIGLNRAGAALQVAAKHADAINTWQLGPTQVADLKKALQEAVEAAGRKAGDVQITCDVVMAIGANRQGAEDMAHMIRDRARGWGRNRTVTDWGADGVLYGDGDAVLEQIARFEELGCSELTCSVGSIDGVRWLNEHVASRLG